MKANHFIPIIASVIFTVCTGQRDAIIIRPDPFQELIFNQTDSREAWKIIESQNGLLESGIPEWVILYLNEGAAGIESLDQYSDRYVFIGENRGTNLNALKQWAMGFNAAQDFPRLLAGRVENRLISSASLYPDDEYGEYFERLIKLVSDSEFQGMEKTQTFWVKRMKDPDITEEDDTETEIEIETERYEYFIFVSIDRELLQTQLKQLMTGITTNRPPTRNQSAAINRIQNTFFEGF